MTESSEALQSDRYRLRLPATRFIGRRRELADVRRLLRQCRLLTLTGTGGCGKTRLSVEAVSGSEGAYRDGVTVVEMAPVNDPKLIAHVVASAIGVRERGEEPPRETLLRALREKDCLVVLDSCEHLVEAVGDLVNHLLIRCPHLHVLATSREPLGLAQEHRWRVPSMSLPSPGASADPNAALAFDAVQLFVDRATTVLPGFELTHENAAFVGLICRRLDGIPLAIELAATRVTVLTPYQIAARLDDCFPLLRAGTPTTLPRHHTLKATIDWSYSLLSTEERTLFSRLSVFAGNFSLQAVEAVAPKLDVLDLLSHLADKSLIQVEERGGRARYRLLDMIRQFARERLDDAGGAQTARSCHASWYLRLAEEAWPELWGSNERRWADRLELEHDNLRAALQWYLEADPDAGLRLAASLWHFWELRGYLSEGRSWLERMLAISSSGNAPGYAEALLGAGYLARDQGDRVTARVRLEESLAVFRDRADQWGIGSALRGLGVLALSEGDYERAESLFEKSLALFVQIDHVLGVGWTLRNLGLVAKLRGDRARAVERLKEALEVLRPLGDKPGMARVLGSLGLLARLQGDHARAQALLNESLVLMEEAGDQRGVAMARTALGSLAMIRGDFADALTCFRQTVELGRSVGDTECVVRALCMMGVLAWKQGDPAVGLRLVAFAMTTYKPLRGCLEPDERDCLDVFLSSAEEALGEEAFARSWTLGQVASEDDAVGLSRRMSVDSEPLSARGETDGPQDIETRRAEGLPARSVEALTARQAEVLHLIAQGKTNRMIAEELFISEYTVMRHVSNIFRRLDVSSRAAAAAYAVRQGLS